MILNYDVEKLNSVLQDFYNATGINITLIQADFSVAELPERTHNDYCRAVIDTKNGAHCCLKSDRALLEKCKKSKKPETHLCHAGLIDVAVPLLVGDQIAAYIILGQMKKESDFSKIAQKLSHLKLNQKDMALYYEKLPSFDDEKISSVVNLASILASHILLKDLLNPQLVANVEKATAFIDANIEKNLSINQICKSINISKSVLYKTFHDYFGCTVSDYIKQKRIEKSTKLLKKTDLSIEEISIQVGFSSASYFSIIFKKQKGISPIKYRKNG